MTQVELNPGESIESLIKRFKKVVERSGILSECRRRQAFEKPSAKKRRKKIAAKKRFLKKEKKLARYRDRARRGKNWKWNKDKTERIPTVLRRNKLDCKNNWHRDDADKQNKRKSFVNNPRRVEKRPSQNYER